MRRADRHSRLRRNDGTNAKNVISAEVGWKPQTLYVNRSYYRCTLLPRFGGQSIADIDRQAVEHWFASLRATPVSADRSMPVLSVILTEAERMLAGCRLRQLYILDLGHDQPTVLLTNDTRTPKTLITRYAQRMLIENAICDAVRFFRIDALSSAVAMKVDFDMTLLVIASGRSARFSPNDGDGSDSTVLYFAIRPGERSSRALRARYSGPEIAEAEGDGIEWPDAHRIVVLRRRDQEPLPVVKLERLEGAIDRVDEPQVGNTFASVDRALLVQVEATRRRR